MAEVGYQVRYRMRRALLTVFGPPQLGGHNDPLARLEREHKERRARRRTTNSNGSD